MYNPQNEECLQRSGSIHECSIVPPYLLCSISTRSENSAEIRASAERSLFRMNQIHDLRINTLRNMCYAAGPNNNNGLDRSNNPREPEGGIIPNYILRNVAESQDINQEMRRRMERGLELSSLFRGVRQTAQIPKPQQKQRKIFDMRNSDDRNELPGTFVLADISSSHEYNVTDQAVGDCYRNLGFVYDYYHTVHGRDSVNDRGLPLVASVHFGKSFTNALWDGSGVIYGDGFELLTNFAKSLEVTAYEVTHGVVQWTAGLLYEGQSGALNESVADVFGSLVKQYTSNQRSTEADWLIGDECLLPGVKNTAIRSLKEPGRAYFHPQLGRDPQPKHMNYYVDTPGEDNGGVHRNSGIPNYAFYLAAIGMAKAKFAEHSWDMAGPIWYDALFHQDMHPRCNFERFSRITHDIAHRKYGEEAASVVESAWAAVGVPI